MGRPFPSLGARGAIIACTVIVAAAVLALHLAGRAAICPCGTIELWHGVVQSDENSQQLSDWYSLSHVIHGLLFYAIGWAVFRRWSVAARLTLAVLVEAGWELLENSPIILDRYRAVNMAWGYAGDGTQERRDGKEVYGKGCV